MRREQEEIKKFIEEVQVKGVRSVIFPQSLFFTKVYSGYIHDLEDQSEIFKDFHLFIDLVKNLILLDVKIHIQTNPVIQERLDRFSIIEMVCDMTAIDRHKVLECLMFYHDMSIPQITDRLIYNAKPVFAVSMINKGFQKAKNMLSFNMGYGAKPSKGLRPDEIAIVLDPGFSVLQREELFLGNYRVIELSIFYHKDKKHIKNIVRNAEIRTLKKTEQNKQRQTPVEEIMKNIPSPTIHNSSNENNAKYFAAKKIYDEALRIYNQLKNRSREFSKSAVELKMKSDRQKEVLENIDSMINKGLSGIDYKDLHDAKIQCQRDIKTYSQQCRDFFDLYVQISEQASEAKDDLARAEQELKKYSS